MGNDAVADNTQMIALFRSIDTKDTRQFLTFLTEDAQFRFGNQPPAVGAQTIASMLDGFFPSIKALRHTILNNWTAADHVICEGTVTYTRHNGSTLCVPFVDVFAMTGALIKDFRIYVDVSQLYVTQQ